MSISPVLAWLCTNRLRQNVPKTYGHTLFSVQHIGTGDKVPHYCSVRTAIDALIHGVIRASTRGSVPSAPKLCSLAAGKAFYASFVCSSQLGFPFPQVELRQVQVEHLSGLVTQQQVEFMALETRYMEHLQAEQGLSTGAALGGEAQNLCSSEEPSTETRGWSAGNAGREVSAGNSKTNTNPGEGPTQLSLVGNNKDDAGLGQSVDESRCETNPCNSRAERSAGFAPDRKVPALGLADAWAVARTDCSPDGLSESSCDSSECSFEFDSSPTEAVFEKAELLQVEKKERRGSRRLVEESIEGHEGPESGQGGFGEFFLCSMQSQLNELIGKEGGNHSGSHSGQVLSGETVSVIEWDLQALSDGSLGVDDEVETAASTKAGPGERPPAAWSGSKDKNNTALQKNGAARPEKGLESGVGNSEIELGPSEQLTRGGDLDRGEDRSRQKWVQSAVGTFVEGRRGGPVKAIGGPSQGIWRGGMLLDLGSAYGAEEPDGEVGRPYGDTWETGLGSLSAFAGRGGLQTEPIRGGGKRNSSQAMLGGRGASNREEHMELTDFGSQYEDGSLFGWGSEGDFEGDVMGAPHGSDAGGRRNGQEECGVLLEGRPPMDPETSRRASRIQRQNSPGGGGVAECAHEVVVEAFTLEEHVELGSCMDAQRSSDAFDSSVLISPWSSPLGESYNPALADLNSDSPLRRRASSAPQEGRAAWGGGTKPPQLVPCSPPHARSNPPSPVHFALSGSPTAMTPVPPITPKINSLHFTSPTKKPRSAVVSAANLELNNGHAPKDDLASAARLTGSRMNGKLARKDSLPRRRDAFDVVGLSAQEAEKTLVPRPPASAAPNRKPSVRQLAATVGTGRSSDKENGSANVPTFTLKLGELGIGRKLSAEAEYRKRGGFGKWRRAVGNGRAFMGEVDDSRMRVNNEVAAPEPPPKPRATSSRPLFRALRPSEIGSLGP
jgi:hypothetical protein